MSEDQGIRLVALIEEQGRGGSNPTFKVTNFLSDIKVVERKDGIEDTHLQDEEGKYKFKFDYPEITPLPYTKTFKDLTVIVGENGAGKTSLINKIIRRNNVLNEFLIFQQGEKFWTDNVLADTYNFCSIRSILFDDTRPNIIKFSNAEELYKLYIPENSGRIDASYLENFISSGNKDDAKQLSLDEITHQIQFVEKFQDDIKEFVDYTQKRIAIDFAVKMPFYLDWVGSDSLHHYFWVLIHYSLKQPSIEIQLREHLSYLENEGKILLAYQFLFQNLLFQFFLYDKPLDKDESEFWMSIWHRLYVVNLYIVLIEENGYQVIDDTYKEDIEKIINNLVRDFDRYFTSHNMPLDVELKSYQSVLRETLETIKTNQLTFDSWQKIWKEHRKNCSRVAQEISYTSYFELKKHKKSISFHRNWDRIWAKLRDIGRPDEEINQLKNLGQLLKNYISKPNFSVVHDIINIVSQINITDVKKHIQVKWSGLSSGELALLKSFSHLFLAKKELEKKGSQAEVDDNSVLLLLDEVDLGLHPEWQRRWVSVALPVIEKIFEGKHLQIIMTTHSPILLSDIYQENVLLLDKGGQEVKGIDKTFGQNIYSLFKDSFFLKKMMGDHAYTRIEETMAFLHHKLGNLKAPLPETNSYFTLSEEQKKIWVEKIIASVGEPIIANQLRDLYERAYSEKSEEDRIRAEIRRLQKQLENLRGGDNHDAS